MEVGVGAVALLLVGLGHVVVDHDVDALDVDAAAHQVRRHKDALLALLEGLVHLTPTTAASLREGATRSPVSNA